MQQKYEQTRGFCFIFSLLVFMFFSFPASSYAVETNNTATLQINFPGLTSVHTAVKTADGIAGAATGAGITSSNWKKNGTTITVPQGTYDLLIRKGAAEYIVDNVDCTGNSCLVENIVAILSVSFPGLSSVHTSVYVPDNQNGQISGDKITNKNWQSNQVVIPVLRQVVDVTVQKGAGKITVDNVDCQSGTCQINDITANLVVNFPGLTSVHTAVHLSDGVQNSVSGEKVTHKNWQTNQASITVLRQRYDLKVAKGAETIQIDNVDCSSGNCEVNNLIANLTVNFPNITSVHTSVRLPDNIANQATGEQVTHKNWQNQHVQIAVFRKTYDLLMRRGSSSFAIDDVDCSSGLCEVSDITTTLSVNFPGFKSVHTSVHLPDGNQDSASGEKVSSKNWQNEQAILTFFPGTYDIKITKGDDSYIVDDLVCNTGGCTINDITAQMTVDFPGLSAMHTSVHVPDGSDNTASGGKVTHKNWQTDQALITVFKKSYDVSIRRKNSTPIIKDNVDCSSGQCNVTGIVATLTVKFDGMSSVHTSVHEPDGIIGTAGGEKFTHKNWQKNQVEIAVLKQVYDISVKKGKSKPVIIDNIDCSSGQCLVDNLTATLTVKFPEMRSVHTSVLVPDGAVGTANGEKITHLNWQNDQAILTVFKQIVDVSVRRGKSEPIVIDNVDCTQGNCLVDDITATMTVLFPNMKGVHTSVFTPDNQPGTATGDKVTKLNWQNDQALITVFRQAYDVNVRRGHSEPMIVDNVDCRSGSCTVDDLIATLTVNFEGLRSVHTSVRIPDNNEGSAEGKEVTKLNWKTDQAVIPVFRQIYDLQIRKSKVKKIIDNVDCTSGACVVNELTATLAVKFPGLISVHSSAHIPDGVDNEANGAIAAKSNWKTHETTIVLLRDSYDVKVKHAVESVFDNVDCNSANCEVLVTGNVQAFLINGDLNQPIEDIYVSAYEKLADGTLHKVMKGKTTALGQINFTLDNIESGKIYVLKANNPLGNGKHYFSSLISTAGRYQFIVTKNGDNELDLTPPSISIVTPENNGSVPDIGFSVTGTATDNRTVDKVEITVTDPVKGTQRLSATYNEADQTWAVNIPPALITLNNTAVLTATVFDLAQNQNTSQVSVSVVADNVGPIITFVSHSDNDEVPVTGFLLSGTVTDLTEVSTLSASLQDSTLGLTINNQDVDFSINNGNWTLVVDNGLMTENGNVTITLNATDSVGNPSSNSINLSVVAVNFSDAHMLNRITFGATPDLLTEIESIGALAFLEQQLDPINIDDSSFDALITGNDPVSKEDLQTWTLLHMLHSKRQLLEIMTWFWDNHFNTDINTTRSNAQGIDVSNTVAFEWSENMDFRANALGNFRTLLGISSKSPSMLIYLDSISNVAGDSNENFPRELDELHTMGVNGGYTDLDVENGAEIFTGWHIANDLFFFDMTQHTVGSYTMFAGTPEEVFIPVGGVEQGEILLDALASHPSTAKFICSKLVTLFVNDTPPATLVTRCADEFLTFSNSNNQIERVLRLIMQSAEFSDLNNYRSKIKTPIEYVITALRNLQADSDATDLVSPIRAMGLRLYENPVPTGWSEIGSDWVNAGTLIERIKWINSVVRNQPGSGSSATDPLTFYPTNGFETADGIVGFLLHLTVGDDFTALTRDNALDVLGQDFDLSNPDAETLLRQLNGTVMSNPQYQFQ